MPDNESFALLMKKNEAGKAHSFELFFPGIVKFYKIKEGP